MKRAALSLRVWRIIAATIIVAATGVVSAACLRVGTRTQSVALGVRCSGPSKYLRAKFDLPDQRGCIVIRVSGPAERAGIRQGDLMTGMNGYPITSGPQYSHRFDAEVAGGRF